MARGNSDPTGATPAPRKRSALDLRSRFTWLGQFSDDELSDIAFCNDKEPMRDGELYFDISNPERGQFVGRRGQTVPAGSCIVKRKDVSEHAWRKLLSYGRIREAGR